MAKSRIIKELANKEISIEVGLNRLLIIASDTNNKELIQWAKNELNGYEDEEKIPNYRNAGLGQIIYSGINGRLEVKNQPLPYNSIDKELIEQLGKSKFSEDIATIEQFAAEDNRNIGRDLTFLAGNVYKNTSIQCLSIYMNYSKEVFIGILSSIRTKLIELFIALDKEFGNLDDLDIDVNGKNLKDLNERIDVIIFQDNSIQIGDNNKIKDNSFNKLGEKK